MIIKNKKILVLAAHPDDETLGCGGTIKKLSRYNKIHLLTFTNGHSAREKEDHLNRNILLGKVCKILGISKYNFGNFPDNAMDSVPLIEIVKFIENIIKYTPDIIFTHHPRCLNIDHRIVYMATITAFRPQFGESQKIYSYNVPSSSEWNNFENNRPNVYVNIKKYYQFKIKALNIYKKEMRKYPHPRSIRSILNNLKYNGNLVGLDFAETFTLIRDVQG